MERIWLQQQEGNPDLILFMLGWAATPNAVCHITPPGYDVLVCCGYRSLAPLAAQEFAGYRRIYLFAWSFGVWVAERCCRELPLYRAVALNGTPCPVDERYGMRLRAAQRSMRAMARSGGGNPFCSAKQNHGHNMPQGSFPERSAAEHLEELDRLAEWSRANSTPHLHWDAAFIADKDEMFPPERMRAWWHQVGLGTEFEGRHNPFVNPALVLSCLSS